jgi:hypothetical protein
MNGEFARDEKGRRPTCASCWMFEAEGVDAALVYTFARYDLPHRQAPSADLDLRAVVWSRCSTARLAIMAAATRHAGS